MNDQAQRIRYCISPASGHKVPFLANFIVECTLLEDENRLKEQSGGPDQSGPSWILHVDGAFNAHGSGADLILIGPDGVVAECALRFSFPAFNNQAEYEALLAGLRIAKEMAIRRLKVFIDSQLVVGQATGEFSAKDLAMIKYSDKVQNLRSDFEHLEVLYVPRAENAWADVLSRLATSDYERLGRIFVEHLEFPSIDQKEDSLEVRQISR